MPPVWKILWAPMEKFSVLKRPCTVVAKLVRRVDAPSRSLYRRSILDPGGTPRSRQSFSSPCQLPSGAPSILKQGTHQEYLL